ncbi:MAG TPA: thioredoxin family protein [Egibacteraceae bacterium]|nr:thioredoxin family protein [Egibacteraceae bacterium]
MVQTASTMLPLGTPAPDFELPDSSGKIYRLEDFAGSRALVVMFLCNHCPYVRHIRSALAQMTAQLQDRGVAVVGINSNAAAHPDDTVEQMPEEIDAAGYTFPYLVDAEQTAARAFHAACTPDLFVFDAERRLAYRGQMDDSRPGSSRPVTGEDLRTAVEAVLNGHPVPEPQKPSVGCNIKWLPGNEPNSA